MNNKQLLSIMMVAYENGENKTLSALYNYAVIINAKEIINWYNNKDREEWHDKELNIDFVLDFNGYRHNIKESLEKIKKYISGWYILEKGYEYFYKRHFEKGFQLCYSENNDFGVDFEVINSSIDKCFVHFKCIEGIA